MIKLSNVLKFSCIIVSTLVLSCALFLGCVHNNNDQKFNLIPYPSEIHATGGTYILPTNTLTFENGSVDAHFLTLIKSSFTTIEIKEGTKANISCEIVDSDTIKKEAYQLSINNNGVEIKASTHAGLFYGIQTLRQLIQVGTQGSSKIPMVEIVDYPRFKWRGMHLDVSRHFFSVDEIKQFLDYMAMNKLNTFHWHLVDDQGWRLEIKKYPKLTEIGAWRDNVGFSANQDKGLNRINSTPYGGYYTQEHVRDIVAYASDRNITIVPEIELPGHSAAALVAYPEYYCNNAGALKIWDQAGVSAGVYCAGKEQVFTFLEDVLDETMALFPSEFIHIGGDETPKDTWLACPDCRKRMKEEGAHDEHELQSYFVKRIEKYLNTNNRRLIGWDEILDGGLAPNAAVMSWRGVSGGIKAAEAGHDVVMSPMFPFYFNHTQNHLSSSPGHSGISTLRDVYTFPIIPEDVSEDNRKHIIGIQANMWSEYMPEFRHIEYNLFPRIYAIAEQAWSPSTRSWDDFYSRVQHRLDVVKEAGINVGEVSYHVDIKVKPNYSDKSADIEFISERSDAVFYTLDGSEPKVTSKLYTKTFVVSENAHIKAIQFKADETKTNVSEKEINFHKAFGKPYKLKYDHAPQYDGGGNYGLTNGFLGVMIGVEAKPIEVIIDLGELMKISKINARFKNQPMSWVFSPEKVSYAISEDGSEFKLVKEIIPEQKQSNVNEIVEFLGEFELSNARYVKVVAKNVGVCPDWHPAAGGKAWLFSDEIIVE